jgi:hypothetical protein
MAQLPTVRDGAPILGMDSVSDKKDLSKGQCVSLINAWPGNPPVPRAGCEHHVIGSSTGYIPACAPAVYTTDDGTTYLIVWVSSGSDYILVKINTVTKALTILGTATGMSDPSFSLINVHDRIYSLVNEDMTWDDSDYDSRHKIIMLDDDGDLIHEMCFNVTPAISGLSLADDGIWSAAADNWLEYAFTYLRRTDSSAIDSTTGYAKKASDFLPGDLESPENSSARETIEISGANQKILVNTLANYASRHQAVLEGATHVRIYRTRRCNTQALAQAATKYFCVDIPLRATRHSISNITLDKNPPKITTESNHGWNNGDSVRIVDVDGTTELNGNDYTLASKTGDTFRLSGEDPSDFSAYVDNGAALKNHKDVSGVSITENTVTLVTQTPHGITSDELGKSILFKSLGGATEINDQIISPKQVDSTTQLTFLNPGLNISAYTSGGSVYVLDSGSLAISLMDVTGTHVRVRVLVNNTGKSFLNKKVTFENIGGATELDSLVATVTAETRETYSEPIGGGYTSWGHIEHTYLWLTLDVLSSSVSTPNTEAPIAVSHKWEGGYYGDMREILGNEIDVSSLSFTTNGVQITTTGAHGFTTGQSVYMSGLGGSTELNEQSYQITVVDPTNFTIPYSASYGLGAYTSGGICSNDFALISDVFLCYPQLEIVGHGLSDGDFVALANILGATEFNDNTYSVTVIDDDNVYLSEVDSNDFSAYAGGGTAYAGGFVFEDDVSDATLAGETATLTQTGYMAAPKASFVEYFDSRMWLFGLLSQDKGRAYYSVTPAGESGTPLDNALDNPVKFVSMYKPAFHIDFAIKKSKYTTGAQRLISDTFFFFDQETYALYGSDPTYADPQLASDYIGCAFPDTITLCSIELPKFGGQCILFMSNLGPACVKQGGEVFLLTDFAVAELWPDKSTELYGDLDDHRDWIIKHCSAEFWKNTWFVTYENFAGTAKTWAYYLNPELRDNANAPRGPFQVEMVEL